MSELHNELGKLQTAAEGYENTYQKAITTPSVQAALNKLLMQTEQSLLDEGGSLNGGFININ